MCGRGTEMGRLAWLIGGLVCIGGGLLLVFLLAPGLFGQSGEGPWLYDYGYGWGLIGPFGFPIIGLVMLFFCVLMMGGMMLHGQPHAHGWGSRMAPWQAESTLDILQRRYSQGEITKEQYEEMKRDLDRTA